LSGSSSLIVSTTKEAEEKTAKVRKVTFYVVPKGPFGTGRKR